MKKAGYLLNHPTRIFFLIIFFFSLINPLSSPAAWRCGGPRGGYVNCLARAPSNPAIIYAGSDNGVFKIVNGGLAWSENDALETEIVDLRVAHNNPDIVYAATEDGVYRSADGGRSWTKIGLQGARVNAIGLDPTNHNILYAGLGRVPSPAGDLHGLFKTTDGGVSWHEKLKEDLVVYDLLVDTDDPMTIYAGVRDLYHSTNLRKSTDGGESWISSTIGRISTPATVAFAMTPEGSENVAIYAIVEGWDVFKSVDRGNSWQATETPGIFNSSPWGVAVDPNETSIIYVIQGLPGKHFYKSVDSGKNWSIKTNGLPPGRPSDIAIDPGNGHIHVSLSEGGIYKSGDGAESWQIQNVIQTYIESMAVQPDDSKTVIACIESWGHYPAKTADGGRSWSPIENLPLNSSAVAFDPSQPAKIFVGEGWHSGSFLYVYKTTSGGQSWEKIRILYVFSGSVSVGVADIWIDPVNSNNILVAAEGSGGLYGGGGVYKSTNGGYAWTRPFNLWSSALAADPYDSSIIYVGTAHNGYVFRSADGGSSWDSITPGGDWVWEVRDLAVDDNSHLYAATDEGLLKWDGFNWTKLSGLPEDDISAIAIDHYDDTEIIYTGTGKHGVYLSQDSGNTWTSFNQGLKCLSVTKLSVSNMKPKYLYAGTAYGGVWGRALTNTSGPWIPLLILEDH